MNYRNPDLIERLAGEYVLGTLQGRARERFERLMAESYRVRQAVWSWETQVSPLGTLLPESRPRPKVWRRITAQLPAPRARSARAGRTLWQAWSLAATAAAVILAVMVIVEPAPRPMTPGQVALVADAATQPQWLVSIDLDSGRIRATALNVEAAAAGRAFELWALPEDGAPQSLGLLPVADAAVDSALSRPLIDVLRNASGVAVSLEPAGGSPTGQPTGPVLYQAPLLSL